MIGRGSAVWNWYSINTIIQHNQSINAKGILDSHGIHVDHSNIDTFVQYNYMQDCEAHNVVVTMPISIEIAYMGMEKFFVAVAVTMQFDSPEPLSDEARRQTPKGHQTVFAWVPAELYEMADFGIYIDDIEIGENLKNGLVGEVIDKASIEDAVIVLSNDKD